jgi:AcrR family transcriptional regulator
VVKASRLSAEERRQAIIRAVRQVFAEKGFHGTTTRELADAAGVSEALLFKHFPTKEVLYTAMHPPCGDDQTSAERRRLLDLEPSTSTLVFLVHFLVSKLVLGRPQAGAGEECVLQRLLLHSLMEDGEYARLFLRQVTSRWTTKLQECVKASAAAGEMVPGPVSPGLAAWLVHHLAVMLMTHLHPATPVIDYGLPREKLVEQTVWFALRGLGLADDVIRRHYNPKALALFAG